MRAAAVALLLQHALVTVASGDGRLTASFGVSWPAFLGRHDMRWRWNASEPTWPSSFETAAWCVRQRAAQLDTSGSVV